MQSDNYFTERNKVALIRNGHEFTAVCCQLVNDAKEKVLFHTYAFAEDEVTRPFIDALLNCARRGVQVFAIVDAIGSVEISSALKEEFARADVNFSYFAPILSKRMQNVGRRLHQKMLLIDNAAALVGGINHSRHFIQPENGEPWLDYAILIRGEELYRLQAKVRRLYFKYFPNKAQELRALIKPTPDLPDKTLRARTTVNDFMRFRSEIYRSHIAAINSAKHHIQIFATYFLPGKKLLKELKRASQRGVQVDLIFGAVSDHPTERWSSKYLYSWYLRNKISIYEWDKSVLHGKVTLVDDSWVTIGSYNHNHLSRYVNMELNIEVDDRDFASAVREEIENTKQHCRQITEDCWNNGTSLWQFALYRSTYMLASLMTLASAIFIIRKKEHKLNE